MLGIFLDSETNGLNPKIHRLLEIAYKVVDLSSGFLCESYHSVISQPQEIWQKSDPISLKANGLTKDLVDQGSTEAEVQKQILHSFHKIPIQRKNAIFICQNPSFDRAFFSQLVDADLQEKLLWPYHWLDLASMFWATQMVLVRKNSSEKYPWDVGLSKDQIATFLHLPKESSPHRAMNGVDHLLYCYQRIVGFPFDS
jgi:oligoribonuclease